MELSHHPVQMQRPDNIRRKLANHAEALTPRKVGCRNAKHRAPRERAAIRIHCPCQHGCSEVADSAGVGEPERAVIATRQKRLSEGIARARRKTVAFRARISQVFVVQRDAREQYRLPAAPVLPRSAILSAWTDTSIRVMRGRQNGFWTQSRNPLS